MEPVRKFKKDDVLTLISSYGLISKNNIENEYYYSTGKNFKGRKCTVINVNTPSEYVIERNCWDIEVMIEGNSDSGWFLESEFVEYSQSEKPMPASESKTPTPLMRKKLIKINQNF